jgi:response regulator of citrate/malate metabolism
MNIFILEDDENRMKKFRGKLIGHVIFHADNVKDAKAILSKEKVDVIFLDHDLDNRIYVDSNELNTGYQLAKWIFENNIKYDRVIVHSLNEYGRENIKSILKDAELIPFTLLF